MFDFRAIDFNRKVRNGLGICLLVLILSSAIGYYSIKKLIQQSKSVEYTHLIIRNLEGMISNVKDAETGQRGYLLTGDSLFLKPFISSLAEINAPYLKLDSLTNSNSIQHERLDTLKNMIELRLAKLHEVINEYNSTGKIPLNKIQEGRNMMSDVRDLVERIKLEEYKSLDLKTKDLEIFGQITPLIILITSILAVLGSGFAFVFISRDMENKKRGLEELENLNNTLQSSNKELEDSKYELKKRNHILSGNDELNNVLRGEKSLKKLTVKIVEYLCRYMNAQAGSLYLQSSEGVYRQMASYAFEKNDFVETKYSLGEGLIGQAAMDRKKILVENISENNLNILSGILTIKPSNVLILPLDNNDETVAVVELLSKDPFREEDIEFAENVRDKLAIVINSLIAEQKTAELLYETQNQAEELQTQQEELRQINEELREQKNKLQASEEELRVSQEELQEKNLELQERSTQLRTQYESIKSKNSEIENAKTALQLKIEQIETMSKYKSEFLANMSHELRTPLNSILILAKVISDNKDKNLTEKQIEFAQIIHDSGNDLLRLINDILDLTKIESGKVNLEISSLTINSFDISSQFVQTANSKGIVFKTIIDTNVPDYIQTDKFRVEQILKNLISNAIKFTPVGGTVTFHIHCDNDNRIFLKENLKKANKIIAFSVKDTGIGIPKDKQNIIFEAFQQVDASTTRKYGGTGLGLSISRELASLLGGEIHVESEENVGSTFTLFLPEVYDSELPVFNKPLKPVENNDETVAVSIEENPIKSSKTDNSQNNNHSLKKVLIIEDNQAENIALIEFLSHNNINSESAFSGNVGINKLKTTAFDCVILDINLPDINGLQVLEIIRNDPRNKNIPVIIYSGKDLSEDEIISYRKYTNTIVIKTDLSYKRLIDELKLQLTKGTEKPETIKEEVRQNLPKSAEQILKGKKVLLVDDDMRNIFSMLTVLENEDMITVVANDGKQALERLKEEPDVNIILMDTMMPEMDGLTCTRLIKADPKLSHIPVIAVTAKAMKEDRENAIDAGASDYITKPVDIPKLLSLMRVWLYEDKMKHL